MSVSFNPSWLPQPNEHSGAELPIVAMCEIIMSVKKKGTFLDLLSKEIEEISVENFHYIHIDQSSNLFDLFFAAVQTNCIGMMHLILEDKPSISGHPKLSSFLGYVPLHIASEEMAEEALDMLLEYGADLNIECCGLTPLHRSVMKVHHQAVERLLWHGADVNSQDHRGWTAVHLAIQSESVAMLDLLARYGASFNKQDKEGWSPIHMAIHIDRPRMIPHLVKRAQASTYGIKKEEALSNWPKPGIKTRLF